MTLQPTEPDTTRAAELAQEEAEAASLAAQSPDASLASAPVSDVAGLTAALLDDDDAWTRERYFADDVETHPALRVLREMPA